MMTTEQIQENYAIAAGYKCFNDLIEADINALDWHVSNVQKIYAKQVAEQVLIRASEMYSTVKMYGVEIDLVSVKTILDTPIQLL